MPQEMMPGSPKTDLSQRRKDAKEIQKQHQVTLRYGRWIPRANQTGADPIDWILRILIFLCVFAPLRATGFGPE
jgi:hypothetical protein